MLAPGFNSTIGIKVKFRLPFFLPDASMDEATWVDWKLSLRWMREVYLLVFRLVAPGFNSTITKSLLAFQHNY